MTEPRRDRGRRIAIGALMLAAVAARAAPAPIVIGVLARADDERLEPRRVELAYLGHPLGGPKPGVELAVTESRFELDAARRAARVESAAVHSADEARAAAAKLAAAGAAALVVDLPEAWLAAAAAAVPALPVFNAGTRADALREQGCRANLFHTLPSERMHADALAQTLVARRWSRVLLLHGPRADDGPRRAAAEAAIRRFGLKLVETRPFRLSADPRERELANPLLLTGRVEYDVVWVVDSDGEFARSLPYRTALPRPVVGDAGLVPDAWGPHFERYGAPQLARRFARAAGHAMTGQDWAAWIAAKAVLQATLAGSATPAAYVAEGFHLDGFKGVRLSFRAWDRQLRQPMMLGDGQGVIALAPVDGVMHPRNVLDTLGADAAEKRCAAGTAP